MMDEALKSTTNGLNSLGNTLGNVLGFAMTFISKYAMWILGILFMAVLVKGFGIKIKV